MCVRDDRFDDAAAAVGTCQTETAAAKLRDMGVTPLICTLDQANVLATAAAAGACFPPSTADDNKQCITILLHAH